MHTHIDSFKYLDHKIDIYKFRYDDNRGTGYIIQDSGGRKYYHEVKSKFMIQDVIWDIKTAIDMSLGLHYRRFFNGV